ncbi:MAG: hypothetical protein ACUVQY_11515 [Thermoproteota archaeon]
MMRVKHATGETVRSTIFEWDGNKNEFENARITPSVKIGENTYEWNKFYREIADANLNALKGSEVRELKRRRPSGRGGWRRPRY